MNNIRNLIPSEDVLQNRISLELDSSLQSLLDETAQKREELVKRRKRLILGYSPAVLVIIFINVWAILTFESNDLGQAFVRFGIAFLLVLPIAIFGIYNGLKWAKAKTDFDVDFLRGLLLRAERIMGLSIKYNVNEGVKIEKVKTMKDHGLINYFDRVTINYSYDISSQYPISVSEFLLSESTKRRNLIPKNGIFAGIFVEITLPRTLTAKTLIVSEVDKDSFQHESLWNKLFSTSELRETVLEWNDFENMLHVATTNEAEARYILSPNFMEDLYDWWKNKNDQVRIVFKADKLFILIPTKSFKFGFATTSVEKETVSDYINSVCHPLWRVLLLVDNLRL